MKQCPKCLERNSDDSKFCGNCGENLESVESTSEDISAMAGALLKQANGLFGESAKRAKKAVADGVEKAKEAAETGREKFQNMSQSSEARSPKNSGDFSNNFIDPSEAVQATVGVSYVQSVMSGAGFKNGAAILTDKRLYYFGRSFSNVGRGTNTTTEEGVVSVDEITFTRFVHGSPLSYLVAAIISLLMGLILFVSVLGTSNEFSGVLGAIGLVLAFLGIAFFVAYFAGRCTVLEIAFPGGKYCFDSRWHSAESMREFQRQIHMVKDSLKASQNMKSNKKAETLQ